jgi:hypothetical protein
MIMLVLGKADSSRMLLSLSTIAKLALPAVPNTNTRTWALAADSVGTISERGPQVVAVVFGSAGAAGGISTKAFQPASPDAVGVSSRRCGFGFIRRRQRCASDGVERREDELDVTELERAALADARTTVELELL